MCGHAFATRGPLSVEGVRWHECTNFLTVCRGGVGAGALARWSLARGRWREGVGVEGVGRLRECVSATVLACVDPSDVGLRDIGSS